MLRFLASSAFVLSGIAEAVAVDVSKKKKHKKNAAATQQEAEGATAARDKIMTTAELMKQENVADDPLNPSDPTSPSMAARRANMVPNVAGQGKIEGKATDLGDVGKNEAAPAINHVGDGEPGNSANAAGGGDAEPAQLLAEDGGESVPLGPQFPLALKETDMAKYYEEIKEPYYETSRDDAYLAIGSTDAEKANQQMAKGWNIVVDDPAHLSDRLLGGKVCNKHYFMCAAFIVAICCIIVGGIYYFVFWTGPCCYPGPKYRSSDPKYSGGGILGSRKKEDAGTETGDSEVSGDEV